MTFRTYANSRSIKMINDIVKAEDLNVKISIKENAIGDTMIIVNGDKEEVEILREVYNMVA